MNILTLPILHCCLINAVYCTPTLPLDNRDTFTSIVTVTVTAQTTYATASSSYTDPKQLQHDALNSTNTFRQQHNATALSWNRTLATYAQNWADRCLWKHSGGPNGENLAEGFSNTTSAITAWARESKDYDYSRPTGFSEATGHFTQLVWKATTQLGCAVANCSKNDESFWVDGKEAFGWFFVCEYWPPGNVGGDEDRYFRENVDPVVSRALTLSCRLWLVAVVFLVQVGWGE